MVIRIATNGTQVVGRFNAHNLLLWAGLPPPETIGKCGKCKIVEHLFAQVERMDIYLSIEQRKTPTTMSTMITTTADALIDRDYNAAAMDIITNLRIIDNDLSHNDVMGALSELRTHTHAELHIAPLNEHVAEYALVDAMGKIITSWHGAITKKCACGQVMEAYAYSGHEYQMCKACADAAPDPVFETMKALGIQ